MKRTKILFSAVAIMFMAGTIFTGCKDKEEEKSQEKEKQEKIQKYFESNLSSYPAEFKPFVSEMIKSGMFQQDQKVKLGLVKLQGKLTFKKGGKKYTGTLPKPVYVKVKNGAEVKDYGKKSIVAKFTIEPFKYEWEKNEIDQILRKYELTITSSGSNLPGHTGPAYQTYETFNDVAGYGNPKFQILDVKKEKVQNPNERLEILVWKSDEPWLFRADGEEWGRR